ncbi:hypothetical protein [Bradyrhizobium sp. Ec3.3]|uniref:hypothetical protein n=1 Tax=Bradyrhizobium sp. Ec3.3 TaxID=189753 RepID=UPI00040BD356|nr:hypothetical protein [Bradyrhizobium sp. Ec3.3]
MLCKHFRIEDMTGCLLDQEQLADVDVLFTFQCPDQVLARLTSLKWIQSTGTGIDGFVEYCRRNPQIKLRSKSQ